jgi:hypothetical protein
LAEEGGKNGHAGKKADKRIEALHRHIEVGVLKKREFSFV